MEVLTLEKQRFQTSTDLKSGRNTQRREKKQSRSQSRDRPSLPWPMSGWFDSSLVSWEEYSARSSSRRSPNYLPPEARLTFASGKV